MSADPRPQEQYLEDAADPASDSGLAPAGGAELTMHAQEWAAVLGAAIGAFMAILDIQITNASLREIQGSLGMSFSEGGWISTSYLIAEICVIPLTAFLTKVFGIRRYLLVNCAGFLLSSMLCGVAWDMKSMIVFRVLQGLTGGTLIPLSFQVMLIFMPPHLKNIGLAIFGMTATLAPTLGPSLGGWLTDNYGWRASFFINILPGLAMISMIRFGMPFSKTRLDRLKEMDWIGMLLLLSGLSSLTYVLEDGARYGWFDDRSIQVAFLVCLVTLPTFVAQQLVRKNPLLDLRLFLTPNFALAAGVTSLSAVALYGGIYSLSLYLGQLQGLSASQIGQVMMWVGIPQIFVMPLVPLLMKRVDSRLLAATGLGLFALSNWMSVGLNPGFGADEFRLSLAIRAIGQPLFIVPLSSMAMAMIRPSQAGNASAIFNVMRNIGGSIGIALAGTVALTRQAAHAQIHLEHLTETDPRVFEAFMRLRFALVSQGMDPNKVKESAATLANLWVQKMALYEAFGDVYFLIFLGICAAVLLVFFLRSVDPRASGDAEMIH